MARSGGKRSNTRYLISQGFRKHGPEHMSTYLQNFRLGDYVDIIINPSIHKGMPYKFYHGKTGKIFNITKSSVGVNVEKIVGNRKILKKINIKIEHIKKSKSKVEYLERIKAKDKNRFNKNSNDIQVYFRKNSFFNFNNHVVSFEKIKIIDPEPFCVIV